MRGFKNLFPCQLWNIVNDLVHLSLRFIDGTLLDPSPQGTDAVIGKAGMLVLELKYLVPGFSNRRTPTGRATLRL